MCGDACDWLFALSADQSGADTRLDLDPFVPVGNWYRRMRCIGVDGASAAFDRCSPLIVMMMMVMVIMTMMYDDSLMMNDDDDDGDEIYVDDGSNGCS